MQNTRSESASCDSHWHSARKSNERPSDSSLLCIDCAEKRGDKRRKSSQGCDYLKHKSSRRYKATAKVTRRVARTHAELIGEIDLLLLYIIYCFLVNFSNSSLSCLLTFSAKFCGLLFLSHLILFLLFYLYDHFILLIHSV